MFGFTAKVVDRTRRVADAAAKGAFRSISHAAASLSKDVKSTIENAPVGDPSAPGSPPHGHRRNFFRRAIAYSVADNKRSAVIGTQFSKVGKAGMPHELGGEYKGQNFPPRPFMAPGLERAIPRFAGQFAGSIGE